jgi:hypothetical protein
MHTTDLSRNGQIRGSVFRHGCTDIVHGRYDGFYDGSVDTTGPRGRADAPYAGRCQHRAVIRAVARPRKQGSVELSLWQAAVYIR